MNWLELMCARYKQAEDAWFSPSTITAHWLATPSKTYADELLDWDAFIKVAPVRPTGTLMVTLEYGGRGTPTPVRDSWD